MTRVALVLNHASALLGREKRVAFKWCQGIHPFFDGLRRLVVEKSVEDIAI
jgi:hypothetical protein